MYQVEGCSVLLVLFHVGAETPDGPRRRDPNDGHLVGLQRCHHRLQEGGHGFGRQLLRELAPDPEATAEKKRRGFGVKNKISRGRFMLR